MNFLKLYGRVLVLLGPEARLGWILAGANVALAAAQFAEPVLSADGTSYRAQACGAEMRAEMWEGWIEFVAVGAAVALRTEQETTQSSREGVAYWASGLEPTYLEGAFARARRDAPVAVSA